MFHYGSAILKVNTMIFIDVLKIYIVNICEQVAPVIFHGIDRINNLKCVTRK